VAVFIGFARTYYLRTWTGAPAPSALVHVHAIVFSTWILLVLVQVVLVEKNRRDLHKRLGIAGGGLAMGMIVLGYFAAIAAARRGFVGQFPLEGARLPVAAAALTGFLAAGPIYDWKTRGRIHPANLWGGLSILVSVPLRPLIGNSGPWHDFARWLTR
jgi:hypothetical protein